jgi:hypothetical protein
VCLPPSPPEVTEALRVALAPFDINASPEYDPAARWDWWHIYTPDGARLLVRPEHDGDPRLTHNPLYPSGDPRPVEPLSCDGGPKGLLDIAGMTAVAVAHAGQVWDAWQDLAARHPAAHPLSAFLQRYRDLPEQQRMHRARAEHLAQPLVQALAQRAVRGDPYFSTALLAIDPVSEFGVSRREYLDWAAGSVLYTFALLRLDGRWVDPDNIHELFAVPTGQSSTDVYRRYHHQYVDALADDATIVHVLCHG